VVNKAGQIPGAKTVVDVHHSHSARTGIKHGQKSGKTFKTCSIANTGGTGDNGSFD